MFNNLRHLFDRMFWTFAGVMFVLAFVAVTVTYSMVEASAYAGQFTWTWDDYTNGMSELFKDFGSLVVILVIVAVIIAAIWLNGWFAANRRVGWARAWFVMGIVVALGLLSLVKPESFGFGWAPVFALIGFALIMAFILRIIARALAPALEPVEAVIEETPATGPVAL